MDSNLQSITKLMDFIEENLSEPLDLDRLASQAGYSKYHLHRMFTSIVGVPLHFYVQRRRLTEAARLLVFSNHSVIRIALCAGYETQQSFTRAFKELFQQSPRAFRKQRDYYPLQLKYTVDGNKNMRGDMIMKFRITQSENILLAGYKANTAKGFHVIGQCWERLHANVTHIPGRLDEEFLIALNDYTVDFPENEQPAFDYYAAAEVSSLADIPDGMTGRELPASKYVVFQFQGSPQDSMQPVVEYIYQKWFPQSTARLNEQARYDFAKCQQALDENGKGEVEYWVPIL